MQLLNDTPIEKVDISRKIKFKNSKVTWQGIPLVMPTDEICSTIEVAKALPDVITFVSDDYEVEDLYNFYFEGRPNAVYKLKSFSKFQNLMGKLPKGYLQHVYIDEEFNETVSLVTDIRKKYKNVTIWCQLRDILEATDIVLDTYLQKGVDIVVGNHYYKNVLKVREAYDVHNNGDFFPIKLTEGFEEFRGETDDNLNRTFQNISLPFSENSLESFYKSKVEELRSRVFSSGSRTIEIYSNFAAGY